MTYSEVLTALSSLDARGMDFGVERTRKILDALASPDKKLKIIHIAGTNGKGSTAEYIYRILLAAGKKTAKFTSPAVFSYLEQFDIDGKPIDKELFAKAAERALEYADGATRFEAETAAALYSFALAGCEYAVVECGLGGKYDATNAILKKEVAVITSIGLEHTSILGNSLKEICGHKAGIIKNCPAVVSGYNPAEVLEYFQNSGAFVAGKFEDPPLNGEAQKYNCGTAIAAAKLLKIDESAIYSGVYAVKLGAREEVLTAKDGTKYVLDGAHNPAAFEQLAEFIKSKFGCADVIYGSLADKDVQKNLEAVKSFAKKLYIVPCGSPRNIDMGKLAEECVKCGICAVQCANVGAALEKISKGTAVVCGSFTLMREAKEWIEKKL